MTDDLTFTIVYLDLENYVIRREGGGRDTVDLLPGHPELHGAHISGVISNNPDIEIIDNIPRLVPDYTERCRQRFNDQQRQLRQMEFSDQENGTDVWLFKSLEKCNTASEILSIIYEFRAKKEEIRNKYPYK